MVSMSFSLPLAYVLFNQFDNKSDQPQVESLRKLQTKLKGKKPIQESRAYVPKRAEELSESNLSLSF